MTTTPTEVPMLLQVGHPDIVQRMDVNSLMASVLMGLAGLILLLSIAGFDDPTSTLAMFLLVMGIALVLVSVSRLLCRTKRKVYQPTGSPLVEHTYFFPMKHLPLLQALVSNGCDGISCPTLHSSPSGSVRLDVLQSKDHAFVALQLFEFIPYTYQPLTPPTYYREQQAADLADFLRGV